jgi:hypothetical protein
MFVGLALFGGCVSPRTLVLDRSRAVGQVRSVHIERAQATAEVESSVQDSFETNLVQQLERHRLPQMDAGVRAGLNIRYRFVLHEEGSTAKRVGSGVASLLGSPFYGIGDGAVGVEISYFDAMGEPAGKIIAEVPISGAFASVEGGLGDAAKTIAQYTSDHYLEMAKPQPAAP